jgi:hypothetical protein
MGDNIKQISQAFYGGGQLYTYNRVNKSYTRAIAATFLQSINPQNWTKFYTILTTQINIVKNNKQVTKLAKTAQIQNSKLNKQKDTLLRVVKIFSNFDRKLIAKSIKSGYIQKAGEIGTTFYRIVDAVLIRTTNRLSKSLAKIIKSNLVQSSRINKAKTTNITLNEIRSTRLNKQKQWDPKADQIQGSELIKAKFAILRIVKVFTDRLQKQKNTNIKSTSIFPISLTKKASKHSKVTQIVEATVTRASTRRRGVTSGITYTIASSRIATLHRQFKAVMANTFGINKEIKKDIKTSNINISYIVRDNIAWKFIVQFVTKIVSFKDQIILKSGYAIPDPDSLDPNMVDSSTPSVQGLIYGNSDDDSFIE